ncbi:MAG: hypothetical protein IPN58_10815 [Anaerolineales bacterium]|nr:hypothetical protein [Anaerolineales bacterium]
MKSIHLGKLFNLQMDILPVAFLGTLFLWAGLSAAAFYGVKSPLGESILLGFVAVFLHWVSVLLHHFGHLIAAQMTGYSMSGIQFGMFGILARDFYPDNEPNLPPSIHIRRALGGPIVSGLLSVIFSCFFPSGLGTGTSSACSPCLKIYLLFTLQVFFRLSFNDGSTILENLRRK